MRYGRSVPEGFLPVFSVDSDDEARALIVAACPRGLDGEYYARELAEAQTLANLEAFSTKLDRIHDIMIESGTCTCSAASAHEPQHTRTRKKR